MRVTLWHDDAVKNVALGKHTEQSSFIVNDADRADISSSHKLRGLLHSGRRFGRVRLAVAYHVPDKHRLCLLIWLWGYAVIIDAVRLFGEFCTLRHSSSGSLCL